MFESLIAEKVRRPGQKSHLIREVWPHAGLFFGRRREKRMSFSQEIPFTSPSLPKNHAVQDENRTLSIQFGHMPAPVWPHQA